MWQMLELKRNKGIKSGAEMRKKMLEFRYDTQLLIEGKNLDEDAINEYFISHFKRRLFISCW